jgi:hypothetical protein
MELASNGINQARAVDCWLTSRSASPGTLLAVLCKQLEAVYTASCPFDLGIHEKPYFQNDTRVQPWVVRAGFAQGLNWSERTTSGFASGCMDSCVTLIATVVTSKD